MQFKNTTLKDLKIIEFNPFKDERGGFCKTFHKTNFNINNLEFEISESYFSTNHKSVIRGMHFQTPPYDHDKLVFVTTGEVMDVVVDLRKKSTTYGKIYSTILSVENHTALFIPKGFAHGFQSLQDHTIINYCVSSEYEPLSDSGIHALSLDFEWPLPTNSLSKRDKSFCSFQEFSSPF